MKARLRDTTLTFLATSYFIMPKNKEQSLDQRKKIVDAHLMGDVCTAFSKFFAVSRTGEHCIITKLKETHSLINKPVWGTLERKNIRNNNNSRISAKMVVTDLASSQIECESQNEANSSTLKPDLVLPVTI